jgi:pectate lyase
MKKSIYDVYVTVTSQEQADRLKAICLEYGLPIWLDEVAFMCESEENWLEYIRSQKEFYVTVSNNEFTNFDNKTQITESEFEQLAKEFKQ